MTSAIMPARHRLLQRRDLLWELVMRDIKVRYKRSVLGFAWSLLLPITQLIVFTTLFHHLLATQVRNYPAYVFCGVLAWNWFNASLLSSVGAITENRDLVRRPGVPLVVLPAARVAADLVHFVLALPVLACFIVLGGGSLGAPLMMLPAVIAVEGLLILSLCYMLAAVNVTIRDTRHILTVALMLMFFVTPVFWDIGMAPEPYARYLKWNPMYVLTEAYRAIFLHDRLPDVLPLAALAAAACVLLVVGRGYFVRGSERFAEEV
jgi:lipopolysaccharide transport system permease protein